MEQFTGRRYITLESYTRIGKPKITPVQSLEHDGVLYVRTDPATWKIERIQRNSHMRAALSDRSGKLIGNWIHGRSAHPGGRRKRSHLGDVQERLWDSRLFCGGFRGSLERRAPHECNYCNPVECRSGNNLKPFSKSIKSRKPPLACGFQLFHR